MMLKEGSKFERITKHQHTPVGTFSAHKDVPSVLNKIENTYICKNATTLVMRNTYICKKDKEGDMNYIYM